MSSSGWKGGWRALGVIASLAVFTETAKAGAWTLPKGEGLLIQTNANHRFSDPGQILAFNKRESAIYIEYGVHNRVTLVGRGAIQQWRRPVQTRLQSKGSVFLLTRTEVDYRLGDVEIGARFHVKNLSSWVLSTQVMAVLPFSDQPVTDVRFNGGGEGAELRFMAGRSLWDGAYIDGQIAWRTRPSQPMDELRMDMTMGADAPFNFHLMVQSFSTWRDGSYASRPISDSNHRLQFSVMRPWGQNKRLQVSALTTLARDGVADERALTISVWRSF